MTQRTWNSNDKRIYNDKSQYGFDAFDAGDAKLLASLLNHMETAAANLLAIAELQQDTLERIANNYPSAVEPCKCPPTHSCPKCEIAYLLNEWQQAHEPDQPLTTEEEYWTRRGFPATRLSRIARAAANL